MTSRRMAGAVVATVVTAVVASFAATPGFAQPIDTARIEAGSPNDWLTREGSYKGWNFSGLSQINTGNVKDLQVAWIHVPGHSTRGLQSTPLAADGVLYYSGSYSRVFALDGASGKLLWSYTPELNDALVARQTHSPYNRGVALGEGKVFVGTVDGRLIALDQKTGKPVWDTKLVDSEKLTIGFTGQPLYAKGMVMIGSQGGEWPVRGTIYAVDAATGKGKWAFVTVGPDEASKATWGNDSWRTGGGGGWMPGTYDSQTNSIWWGTSNPAPLYDWSGADWMHNGARPGTNLYITSVLQLDADTGRLKSYHQELPHDAWDFDSAPGEFVSITKGGKDYVVHPNKSGFIFVYDRNDAGKIENVWPIVSAINFVKTIDPKTGELIGRRDFTEGKVTGEPLCPAIAGGVSWNSGSYDPNTGLYYKIGNEWCMTLTVQKTTPVTEPQVQLNIGADFDIVAPPNGPIYGHLDARDPITGEKKWEVRFPEPPVASVLSTAGNLVFLPDARGTVHAYDARTGGELWSHADGVGHQGGIISYAVNGKQYIAVTAGFGGMLSDGYGGMFGEPFKSMPRDEGVLVVYSLPQ
jgi:alcohol dehydrogenase (cytochrome c)